MSVLEYRVLTFGWAREMCCPPPEGRYWTDDDIEEYDQGVWLFVDGVGTECVGTDGRERYWTWIVPALNRALKLGAQSGRLGTA